MSKRPSIEPGDRVYHRRADMFAIVELADGGHAEIRYEWPHDGKKTVRVSVTELCHASDVS